MSSTASVDQLAARFLACAIPREEWTHHAHLVVGAWHVHRYGPERALALLRVGIRRLNEANGVVNSAASGYHETITRAYVALLAQLLDACPVGMSLGERVVRIVAGPLADKDVLFTFYSRARLMSAAGRAAWIEPDLAPLRLTATFADEGTAQAGPANFPPPPQLSPSRRADGPLGFAHQGGQRWLRFVERSRSTRARRPRGRRCATWARCTPGSSPASSPTRASRTGRAS